jgi:hypothetical protein
MSCASSSIFVFKHPPQSTQSENMHPTRQKKCMNAKETHLPLQELHVPHKASQIAIHHDHEMHTITATYKVAPSPALPFLQSFSKPSTPWLAPAQAGIKLGHPKPHTHIQES